MCRWGSYSQIIICFSKKMNIYHVQDAPFWIILAKDLKKYYSVSIHQKHPRPLTLDPDFFFGFFLYFFFYKKRGFLWVKAKKPKNKLKWIFLSFFFLFVWNILYLKASERVVYVKMRYFIIFLLFFCITPTLHKVRTYLLIGLSFSNLNRAIGGFHLDGVSLRGSKLSSSKQGMFLTLKRKIFLKWVSAQMIYYYLLKNCGNYSG